MNRRDAMILVLLTAASVAGAMNYLRRPRSLSVEPDGALLAITDVENPDADQSALIKAQPHPPVGMILPGTRVDVVAREINKRARWIVKNVLVTKTRYEVDHAGQGIMQPTFMLQVTTQENEKLARASRDGAEFLVVVHRNENPKDR